MIKIYEIIYTGLYIGYLPVAPGTLGSLTAGLIMWFLGELTGINWIFRIVLSILTFLVGMVAVAALLKDSKEKDPGYVIIDEWAGQFTTYCFAPITIENLIIGFIFFRIFDISKLFPVNRTERLKGALGVMADDIVAGIYAGACLLLYDRFIHKLLG